MTAELFRIVEKEARAAPEVMDILNDIIEAAERKNLNSIGFVAVEPDGTIHSAFELGNNRFALLGALEHLKLRIMEA